MTNFLFKKSFGISSDIITSMNLNPVYYYRSLFWENLPNSPTLFENLVRLKGSFPHLGIELRTFLKDVPIWCFCILGELVFVLVNEVCIGFVQNRFYVPCNVNYLRNSEIKRWIFLFWCIWFRLCSLVKYGFGC